MNTFTAKSTTGTQWGFKACKYVQKIKKRYVINWWRWYRIGNQIGNWVKTENIEAIVHTIGSNPQTLRSNTSCPTLSNVNLQSEFSPFQTNVQNQLPFIFVFFSFPLCTFTSDFAPISFFDCFVSVSKVMGTYECRMLCILQWKCQIQNPYKYHTSYTTLLIPNNFKSQEGHQYICIRLSL